MDELIPYHTILAAKGGDSEAMETILVHYEPLITKYATRRTHDEYGNSYVIVDEDMKARIVAELIFQIIYSFDPTKLPHSEELEA